MIINEEYFLIDGEIEGNHSNIECVGLVHFSNYPQP